MRFDHHHVDVFVGVDMAKQDHYAQAVATSGSELFHRPVLNDEAAIEKCGSPDGRVGHAAA